MRVAIVHDYLTQRGGAERVVLSLLRLFPDADLYTSVYDPDCTYPEFREYEVRTTWLQRFMRPGRDPRWMLPLYPRAFRRMRLESYDLVLSSSSGFAHGVRVVDGIHVVYCHTPPRFLYQTDTYVGDAGALPRSARAALPSVLRRLRRWDQAAAARPDCYVANSSVVASRIEAIYGRTSVVVPPPADVGTRPVDASVQDEQPPYFLVISRLLPYKRVDLAIRACAAIGARVVVVGEGPERQALESLGAEHVSLRGRVSDPELSALLHGCTALIQAGTEDFGIAPLESNASGRPVVAYAEGGALETVVHGITGLLVSTQSVEAFTEALTTAQSTRWSADQLRAHAASFSEPLFHARLLQVLADLGAIEAPAASGATRVTALDARPSRIPA